MRIFAICLSCLLLCVLAAQAGVRQFVLRDYFNQQWTRELVTYSIAAAKGECTVEGVTLKGPKGEQIPVQLSEVVYWPGTAWVKTAKLSFIVDLLPLAVDTYTVTLAALPPVNTNPLALDSSRPSPDLLARKSKVSVELLTSKFGARFPLGTWEFTPPADASDVKAPLLGMRLADGTWFGGGEMYGAKKVKRLVAELTDDGPVFARVAMTYTYADNITMRVTALLAAGDAQVYWDMDVEPRNWEAIKQMTAGKWLAEDPGRKDPHVPYGWQLQLTPGLAGLRQVVIPEFGDLRWGKHEYINGRWKDDPVNVEFAKEPAGPLTALVPWTDWWDETTSPSWKFNTAERGDVLTSAIRDPGAWVEPAAPGTWTHWSNPRMCQKWLPLIKGAQGAVYYQVSADSGIRRWQLGGAQPGVGRRLHTLLNEYVLSWPENPKFRHPHLFLSAAQLKQVQARPVDQQQIKTLLQGAQGWKPGSGPHGSDDAALGAYLLTGDPKVAADGRIVERLRNHLDLLGNYDRMRLVGIVTALYDALVDGPLVTPRERQVFRAKMAYLAYLQADPATWSMERGYASGNQNMSVSYILNLGLVACTIPDHPMAKTWAASAMAMMDKWLAESVGTAGEWPESVANYAHVSASSMITFAIAAKNAGLHDYVNDPRMKRFMLYLAKQYTPPDPRKGASLDRQPGLRALPPSGRAGAGARWGLPGMMARATMDSDPEYAKAQQWMWKREGLPTLIGDSRIGGYSYVYLDPTLPEKNPGWTSDLFPRVGAILRQGLGTPDEYYINLLSTYENDTYPSESGSLAAFFAKGAPIQCRFAGGYAEREELFTSRVLPARPSGDFQYRWNHFYHDGTRAITAFVPFTRQDYVAVDSTIEKPAYLSLESGAHDKMMALPAWPPVAKEANGTINWKRQLLFIKDTTAAGASYVLLRDTVSGGQPTMWQFWNVSEKIGTPSQVRDVKTFLADKPGNKEMPARELKSERHKEGRFTAVGQFDVDTEFFVASPNAGPFYTLRWGKEYHYSPIHMFSEYQDLFHLQLPGDGAYYVAVFPRKRNEPVPEFDVLSDNNAIIKVSGDFGTDLGFLYDTVCDARGGGAFFHGTAASIQDRKDGLTLSLGAPGTVRYKDVELTAPTPASLWAGERTMSIDLPAAHTGTTITLAAPWVLVNMDKRVTLKEKEGGYTITIPKGVDHIVLVKS
ncbi:MAG TPA: hypothetical protein VGM23_08500 [Armatimonadota bacterium]|jgi:hypothetical protein